MRIRILSLLFIFLLPAHSVLYAENKKQVIVILPFINTGTKYKNLDEELFASYFYVYFAKLENCTVVYPSRILNFKAEHSYSTTELYSLEVLGRIAEKFESDFIIGGEYRIENETLKVNLDTFGKQTKIIIQREFEIKIETDVIDALYQVVLATTNTFSKYNPESANLIVSTDQLCVLYIGDERFGTTPGRFNLPAGKYDIRIVYEDDTFTKTVFRKEIELAKGALYDTGKIQVLTSLYVTANVKAEVLLDGRVIGFTDITCKIPSGNDYILEVAYTDERGEKRSFSETISNSEGKDIFREYTFPARITMMSGNIPLSGRAGTEIRKLPHTFDNLFPGTYNVQFLLEDPQWKRNFIFCDQKVTLGTAQTVLIDKSDFIYGKYWGLCFIPSAAQFYNFEPVKGYVVLGLSLLSAIGSGISGYLMADHYFSQYLSVLANDGEGIGSSEFNQIVNTQTYLTIGTLSGIALFGAVYVYSCIDGMITMDHLYKLLYPAE